MAAGRQQLLSAAIACRGWYGIAIVTALALAQIAGMKRFVSIPLWFYTGWTAGAFVDYVGGMTGLTIGPALGPILGATAAALFVGDPRRLIWSTATRDDRTAPATTRQVGNAA